MGRTTCACLTAFLCALPATTSFAIGPGSGPSASSPTGIARVAAIPADASECIDVPGAMVHDDGTYEGGFGGYFEVIDSTEFVDWFVPSVHPATFTHVCVAISNTGPGVSDFDFDVHVYADAGEGQGPGALLGSVPAHIDTVPEYADGAQGQFFVVDISPLLLDIPQGGVFVGVEWNAMLYPGNFVWINSDAWSGGAFGGGYYRNTFTPWTSMYWAFLSSYRALQIRVIERALQPTLALDATALAIDDHCVADPEGGNGVAEPGELIDFSVPVFASTGDFTAVRVELTAPVPDGVQYVAASTEAGDIADGARASASFQIALDAGLTCLQDVRLPVSITSDQASFTGFVDLPIGRAVEAIAPAGMPLKIPNRDEEGIVSVLDVPQSAAIEGLSVRVSLNHFTVSDLIVKLTSPAGTTITLLDRPGYPPFPGCENSVGDIHFIDGASDPENVCAEPAGGTPWPVHEAAPVQPLAMLVGEDMQGSWTLTVIDPDANNAGALTGWSLHPIPALGDVCRICGDAPDVVFADGFDGD